MNLCEKQYLDKEDANPNTFQEGRDCPICMMEFKSEDIITQLKCNKLHIYHRDCL